MANESINLNLIPTGEMPVIHVSQFDNGRQFNINLFKGNDEYTLPSGYTATLNCRKADRNIVTLATTSVLSNALTFTTTTQLCACAGKNLCEVAIKDAEDYQVGTLNFILEVEKDPLQGGIDSTSEIHDLEDQIEDITTEIISENYYTKTETDTLLDAKADASDVYTKTQTDSLLSAKADASSVYTKTQVDNALSSKADAADVYTKTQVDTALSAKANAADLATVATTGDYDDLLNKPTIPAAQVQSDYAQSDNTQVDYIKNKPDISGMIDQAIYDIMPIASVSFSPVASFNTEISAPLQDIKCKITPAQSGEGTPSPSNLRPIIAYTSLNLTANGDTHTIAFGQTVYGGVLDVTSGKLTVTHGSVDIGSLDYVYSDSGFSTQLPNNAKELNSNAEVLNCISDMYEVMSWNDATYNKQSGKMGTGVLRYIVIYNSAYSDASAFKTAMSGRILAYELATPFDIDLTPVQISAIVGDNTVYADCGDTEVKYKDTIQHYIDTRT